MIRTTNFAGTYNDIEEFAKRLREKAKAKIGKNNPSSRELLEWLVRKLKGQIETAPGNADFDEQTESLVIKGRGDFTIYLSPYTSSLRDNFTIAHELAHYLLHYDHKTTEPHPPVIFNRYGSDRKEWQANRFAAAFLMPADEFKRVFARYEGNLGRISGHFQVSEPAVKIRAEYIHS